MDRKLRSRAKTRILRWFDSTSQSPRDRSTMSHSIDRMLDELPNRDNWFEVMTVALGETKNLGFAIGSRTWRAIPCSEALVVSTVVPGWSFGWGTVLPDQVAYDTLTWFLHYARQYIHRSQVAKVLMIAWQRHGHVLHPFAGPGGGSRRYGPMSPAPSLITMLDTATDEARARWGAAAELKPTRSAWTNANTLDPQIHQAIFHFLRGQALLASKFEMEAVVAFDCVIAALKGLLMRGKVATSATGRADVCRLLGLNQRDAETVDGGYFHRNNFGAHAGGWRWWDHAELTEDLAPAMADVALRALRQTSRLEPSMRAIDPDPNKSPCNWLVGHFDLLWDSVWFDKLHGL